MVLAHHIDDALLDLEFILLGLLEEFVAESDAVVSDFSISHQDDVWVFLVHYHPGDTLWRSSSHTPPAGDELLKLLFGRQVALGIPEVVVGNVLAVLFKEEVDSFPVIHASSSRTGVIDEDGVLFSFVHT
jgi:hypothetical protein